MIRKAAPRANALIHVSWVDPHASGPPAREQRRLLLVPALPQALYVLARPGEETVRLSARLAEVDPARSIVGVALAVVLMGFAAEGFPAAEALGFARAGLTPADNTDGAISMVPMASGRLSASFARFRTSNSSTR